MLGLLIILIISWLILHFIEKTNLNALGFLPIKKSLIHFGIGLFFVFLLKLLFIFIETKVHSIIWIPSSNFNWNSLLLGFWYHLKSALTEDLVFRGAILYILIKRLGLQIGIILSAMAFGIYHWFSYSMLGSNWLPMTLVFLGTGFTGYVWGYTFAKTQSIFLALGFHLGWNLCSSFFYPSQPFGELLYQQSSRVELSEWNSLYFYLFNNLIPPLITLIFVKAFTRNGKI